mgnify:CR=1 FL=1
MPPATDGRNFALRPFDSSDLMVWALFKSNVAKFVVIQTHLACLSTALSPTTQRIAEPVPQGIKYRVHLGTDACGQLPIFF